ncbi:MAG: hypothetical protein UT02_C0021G0016 [Parcubacteria group bacterium GW2011_GWC2_38_7]|nr:MAG: hypothetical protein UT02_C0021G0016 [Parcubacteria group bacterium GW2011_GWC2_38_7]
MTEGGEKKLSQREQIVFQVMRPHVSLTDTQDAVVPSGENRHRTQNARRVLNEKKVQLICEDCVKCRI